MSLIDADTLWKVFENAGWWDNADRDIAQDLLDQAPPVDAEPIRHGRWIYGITLNHEWKKCSECLVSQGIFGCFTYCPNCGAKMDGEKQDATN